MESPWCRSSKRSRASNDGAQVPSCLVDGCNSDLSKCRDYHRRHKVCELHSKTPKVTIRGQEQRFCQQCSRFHSLGEFDDRKRSCRKRLDGHNRRRRKAQSDPSLRSSCFRINHRGTELIRFSSPETASALASCSWAGALKPEIDSVLHSSSSVIYQQLNFGDGKMLLPTSSPPSYRPQIQFPFMQFNKDPSSGCSVSGTSPGPRPMTGDNGGCSSQKMLPSWLFESPSNSGCALSLLSSSSVQAAAAAAPQSPHHTDALTTMQFNLLECSHSPMPTLHQNRVRVSEPTSNFLSAPGSLHEMFQGGHDGSSATGSQSHRTPSSSPPGSKHPSAPGQFSYFSSH